MLAATIRAGQVRVEEHPDPSPGTGELLVRVRAAGLNGADLLQRKGLYPAPPGFLPDIPGIELAGEVVATGPEAKRFAAGDRVMAIVVGGGQGELCLVHERQALPVPAGLDWPAAGGLPETFTTAYDALFRQCDLRSGERLLVHGAAGGVGTAAVQLGVVTGAHVTATVRNPAARDAVAELGAHEILDPADFSGHGPYDVILELVGAPNMPANVESLDIGGRIVVIGVGAGQIAEVNLRTLMDKRAALRASTLRTRDPEEKATIARGMERHVVSLFDRGELTVPVAQTFPLEAVEEAYERFAAGGKIGKIVVVMGG